MSRPEHTVVISQPMYFPWVGMLEQMALSDTFIFYDDVQFSRGGVLNRIQIKVDGDTRWMTVPLKGQRLGQNIDEVQVDDATAWRTTHLDLLSKAYRDAPHRDDMLGLAAEVLHHPSSSLAELTMRSMHVLADYFGLFANTRIMKSSGMGVAGRSSIRVRDICVAAGATRYATGHGAKNYLDHDAFEQVGIEVEYMDYQRLPYPQSSGPFTPYVSGLDLVANCGKAGVAFIAPATTPWRSVLAATNS